MTEGTHDSDQDSGRLRPIRNDRLRKAVAAWPGVLALLRETEDEMSEDVTKFFYPYLSARIPFVTMDDRSGFLDMPSPSRFPSDYKALLSDVAFENQVEDRWTMAHFNLRDGEPVRRAQILRLIKGELGDAK